MPQYQSHKKVWALKIQELRMDGEDGGAFITPDEEGFTKFRVSAEYVRKNFHGLEVRQIIGGYFVQYEDGYQSFSPEKAFLQGHTRI